MRWAIVFTLLVASTSVAKPSPPPPPPQCLGPDTWDNLARCLREHEPSLTDTVKLSEHARGATDSTHRWGRIYVQELDGRWRNQRAFAPTVEIVGDTQTPTTNGHAIRRVEVREALDYGNRTTVRMKSAVVCGAGSPACQLRVYECVALVAGRTVDIAAGELRVDPKTNQLALDVDRSHAGTYCNNF